MLTEKEIKIIAESIEAKIREGVTKEEALATFVGAGIMDWDGNYTPPFRKMLDDAGIDA